MDKHVFLNVPLIIGALALAGCMASPPVAASQSVPLGVDLGASKRIASMVPRPADPGLQDASKRGSGGGVRLAQAGRSDAHASGVVNSSNPQRHTVNISHQAIPGIGWPPMTMDFTVAPSVKLNGIAPGTRVDFTLQKGSDGMYQIQSLAPAKPER